MNSYDLFFNLSVFLCNPMQMDDGMKTFKTKIDLHLGVMCCFSVYYVFNSICNTNIHQKVNIIANVEFFFLHI